MRKVIVFIVSILYVLSFSSCKEEVEKPALHEITLSGVPGKIIEGNTTSFKLNANGKDQFGNNFSSEYTWSSSEETKAVVDNKGLVTIKAEGIVTISATSLGIIGSIQLTILPKAELTKIELTGKPSQVIAGITKSFQLIATGKDQYNLPFTLPSVEWSTSDQSKATITGSGLVSIIGSGAIEIVALSNGISGKLNFNIIPQPKFEVFVSSRGSNSVKRFNGDNGSFIDDFVPAGSGGLSITQEVAFGPDGHLYVSGRGNTSILKYDKTSGAFLGGFTTGYALDEPTKMAFGPDGKLYVSQWGQSKNKVARFKASTGAFIDEITSGLNQGMAHAWDADGNLFIVSYGSKDVRKFDTNGTFIEVFTSGGNLQGPVNLWFGSDNMLYVVDWETGSVQVFNGTTGVFVKNFVTGLTRVEGFSFDNEGGLYLCDWVQNVVNKYDASTGNFISTYISGSGLNQPNSIAIRLK